MNGKGMLHEYLRVRWGYFIKSKWMLLNDFASISGSNNQNYLMETEKSYEVDDSGHSVRSTFVNLIPVGDLTMS